MTKKKRYKRYSPEFKREALKRASDTIGIIPEVAAGEVGRNVRIVGPTETNYG